MVVPIGLAILGYCSANFASALADPGTTVRVSVASDGTQANGESSLPAVSEDGRFVAFVSSATNLVAADANQAVDVFVHDRQTGTTERVSVATGGAEGNADSGNVGLAGRRNLGVSADGRFVAFDSNASNLVVGDTNNVSDIFVHDRQTGATERISVATDGTQANRVSGDPAISAEGRFVAFVSNASNLVVGDTNNVSDIFVHDRETGMTERISIAADASEAMGFSVANAISGDGLVIAFDSAASNLVAGDTVFVDTFVRDRASTVTERVSVATGGTEQDATPSFLRGMSRDGRIVVFQSPATNLVPGDANGFSDIFIRDRQSGETSRASVASDGSGAMGPSQSGGISGDGTTVGFVSSASNLVAGDANGVTDVFLRDRPSGATERVSIAADGSEANGHSLSFPVALDRFGFIVAFQSSASNLVAGDTNRVADIFVRDRTPYFRYEYAAKLVCGVQGRPDDMRLARGFYATTINVHNPNDADANFFKKLALTIPPGGQKAGRIHLIAKDRLAYDEALAVDCADIDRRVFNGDLPARYIEGFVVIQSMQSLDVVAVYTTAALDPNGRVTLHSSIDVEDVAERDKGEATDLSIRKSIAALDSNTTDRHTAAFLHYRIEVTNNGPGEAEDVTVTDHLESELPTLGVNEASFDATHNGMWSLVDATDRTADIEVKIATLPAGEVAILEFVASVVFDSADPVKVTDTANVASETTDTNAGNDTAHVATILGQ